MAVGLRRSFPGLLRGRCPPNPFLSAVQLAANIETDAQGRFVGVHSPGEPGYRNAFAGPTFSYRDLVDERLAWLEQTGGYYVPADNLLTALAHLDHLDFQTGDGGVGPAG